MAISALFSVGGISFSKPGFEKIAWFIAILLIIVEIVWNKKGPQHGVTLYIAGFSAYGYGIITNIVGVYLAIHIVMPTSFVITDWIIPLFLGLLLELLPEPLLLWSITGDSTKSDPIANVMGYQQGLEPKTSSGGADAARLRYQARHPSFIVPEE
jgi:uncharacterized membrane protein YtjA (UPF0391 family)